MFEDVEKLARAYALAVRYRWWILAVPAVLAVTALLWTVSQDRSYTAVAAFMPQAGQTAQPTGALARQFGISLGSGRPSESPHFYVDLLKTRELLSEIAAASYTINGDVAPVSGSLYALLDDGGLPEDEARRAVERRLRNAIQTEISREAGIVRVAITLPYPDLAEQVADEAIRQLQAFNLQRRQSQARSEAEFAAERVEEARAELDRAEEDLKTFLQQNRQFQNSPELRFEHDRLERRVSSRQDLHGSLENSLEQARIEAVRNTPVITLIESGSGSAEPQSRGTITNTFVAGFVGLVLVVLIIMVREAWLIARVTMRTGEVPEVGGASAAASPPPREISVRPPKRPVRS